jgi:hypothetical protein
MPERVVRYRRARPVGGQLQRRSLGNVPGRRVGRRHRPARPRRLVGGGQLGQPALAGHHAQQVAVWREAHQPAPEGALRIRLQRLGGEQLGDDRGVAGFQHRQAGPAEAVPRDEGVERGTEGGDIEMTIQAYGCAGQAHGHPSPQEFTGSSMSSSRKPLA